MSEAAKPSFTAWVEISRAKKAWSMARDLLAYHDVSPDGRIRPLIGRGPVTNRWSEKEPNGQQFPRDPDFRQIIEADEGYMICSCDFSALDMRVGAALAIRAQRQIFDAIMGAEESAPGARGLVNAAREVWYQGAAHSFDYAEQRLAKIAEEFNELLEHEYDTPDREEWWKKRKALSAQRDQETFRRAYSRVRLQCEAKGVSEWGALRDAFELERVTNGLPVDIHTVTAASMVGLKTAEIFEGMSPQEIVKTMKELKTRLSDKAQNDGIDRRQNGKVANLSLLYYMQALGLVDTAAKNYNVHWTAEEAEIIIRDWLIGFPEIEVWHIWTKHNAESTVKLPDRKRGGKVSTKSVFASMTLEGRKIYAFGVNAALAYEDQSTGSDILARAMRTLREDYPEIGDNIVNQVHDELLFEFPADKAKEWGATACKVMIEAADHYLFPFGIRSNVEPQVARHWSK